MALDAKSSIVAGQLAGDFTLPEDKNKKLAFIAGGIGITPFRSMIKYLLDLEEARPITLFYSNKYANEIVYADIFHQADKNLGIKTVYTLTETEFVPSGWLGKIGRINEVMIKSEVPDYSERIFYLSGPHTMVTAFEDVLRGMGISKNKIKTDFFPGFV
jgi:ferredoxin-NADP reductase